MSTEGSTSEKTPDIESEINTVRVRNGNYIYVCIRRKWRDRNNLPCFMGMEGFALTAIEIPKALKSIG